MRVPTANLILLLVCLLVPACGRIETPDPPPALPKRFTSSEDPPRVLLIAETEGPGGATVAESAKALETLISHFDERCATVSAQHYQSGSLGEYYAVFYLGGKPDRDARAAFSIDAAQHNGPVIWVGPGIESIGDTFMSALDLRLQPHRDVQAGAVPWSISYKDRQFQERLILPAIEGGKNPLPLATAQTQSHTLPFIVGRDRLWYLAAGPSLHQNRFWTACIWADILHDILGRPHEGRARRLVPVLRDVPVWANSTQVPQAIRPMLASGIPVAILAWTNWGDVPLADRPDAVEGLRKAESLGATIALVADTGVDSQEHFRLAWEVGLHPVAWAGPTDSNKPFHLRIAGRDESPPYCAGGILPAPIDVTDAGLIDQEHAQRLEMSEVVRDAVVLVSFGLWAPPEPFRGFIDEKSLDGWSIADLRDFDVRVRSVRRALISGVADIRAPGSTHIRQTTFATDWSTSDRTTYTTPDDSVTTLSLRAPERSTTLVEIVEATPHHRFLKGVTLDPWAYSKFSLSAQELSETLAERYKRNGVNTVFFYAYNVDEGAAYRTRYRGATVSDWGRQDLLAHLLQACHKRNIDIVAWVYGGRDRAMWKKHSEWRERTRQGKAHNPLRLHAAYFLCPRNPEVRDWYAGLLGDLAHRYPTLEGIEICEPVVNWFGDQACYCDVCRSEFAAEHPDEPLGEKTWRRFRARGLTDFLSTCIKTISAEGIDTYIMTISDAWSNGAILSPNRQADESGFDLDALLDGPYPPDWMNFEIIWQQWAALYGTEVFNYDWAEETATRLVRRTDGRARVLLHVELTDFGPQRMTPKKIADTIERVSKASPEGIECYHSEAIDSKAAWPVLKRVYEELP